MNFSSLGDSSVEPSDKAAGKPALKRGHSQEGAQVTSPKEGTSLSDPSTEELRQRLHKKLAELRKQRNAPEFKKARGDAEAAAGGMKKKGTQHQKGSSQAAVKSRVEGEEFPSADSSADTFLEFSKFDFSLEPGSAGSAVLEAKRNIRKKPTTQELLKQVRLAVLHLCCVVSWRLLSDLGAHLLGSVVVPP